MTAIADHLQKLSETQKKLLKHFGISFANNFAEANER